jgi:protein-tyrosine-phosphatase
MTDYVPARRPQSILFACSTNAVRSPMAEALGRHYFGKQIFFASAGLKRGERDDFAISIMDEIGLDISKHRPHTFEDLDDTNFDLIISLSAEAHHRALEFTRTMAIDVLYWPTIDATAFEGSRERILDGYRDVRDGLSKRIKNFLDFRPIGTV